ncbi:outer membrane protein [Devosia epidermidihirudinis]|uniref:outer membrane protein n=1 Tax=Devosia epidermidihirudinis TaxID=1293439 RepID=UPI0006987BFB|nr:outer membrane protein [Devosia epidermidihirudinis]
MKRFALLISAAVLSATPAFAADLNWNSGGNGASTIYSSTPATDWTGFYAGVNGGYAWGTQTNQPNAAPRTETNSNGWQVGGQAGYNVDLGGLVIGGEADLQWANVGVEHDIANGTSKTGIDLYGTIRGRAGATFGQVMPYVTAGFAAGRGSVTNSTTVNNVSSKTSEAQTHLGWTAGLGIEAKATDNITVKAEYMYVDLGTQNYALAGGDVTQRFSVIRAGVNYKF